MISEIILVVTIFLNLILGVFVFSQNTKSTSHRVFSLLAFLGAIWSTSNLLTGLTQTVYWLILTYAIGLLVISCGLMWTYILVEKKISLQKMTVVLGLVFVFFFLSFQENFLVRLPLNGLIVGDINKMTGWGLPMYALLYVTLAVIMILKLYTAQRKTHGLSEASQYKLVLIGATISLLASAFTSFIIPFSKISLSGTLDSTGFLIFACFVSYAITRHQLFNIQIITIELVTLCLWLSILIKVIFVNTFQEMLLEAYLLIISLVFGIMLIKSTISEIENREHIKKLTDELSKTYSAIKLLGNEFELKKYNNRLDATTFKLNKNKE